MAARILIIEDNPANLELVRYLLDASGYTTLAAADGHEGLRLVAEARPELVLCDLQLPGLNGYQVLSEIRVDPKSAAIPVVAVTAFSMLGDRAKALSSGFDGYISKPIDPEAFVSQVEAFLTAAQRAPRPDPSG